jgi:superfamily II DNA or RNA helicase
MEALGSKRVLVLAPTLLLVKQLRDEWMRERTSTWATLAVCSDIGTNEGDDSTHVSPGEIGSKPTTDPAEIAIFLKSKGPYVVFGTYASSARIATAQKKAGVPAFDLVVADEAHRIAGAVGKADKEERAQRVVLDETGIRAERRLFATATPRVYGGDKKKDGEEIVLESMDDPARFGEEVYKLTFQQAVDLKRLVPYKLLVTIVTNEEVQALIHDRVYLDVQGKKITIDDLATAIAVRRAYKELGISRVISYHGNIKRARAFAQLVQEVKAPGKAPETECVTGAMPVEDRKEALSRLANAEGPYLITNARCLTEGIDVPALDAVAFVDPRKSQVDIVQAVGRAMRKPRGTSSKTTGYIILPVFLSKADLKDPEAAVEGGAFAPVLQVLRALKAHDPYRAPFFAKILVEQGKRPHKKGEGIDEILQVSIGKEFDRALAKRLEQAVQLRAIEVAADPFTVWVEVLQAFVARENHARVPQDHIEGTRNLGRWVANQRKRRHELNQEQIAQLGRLGFVWNALDDNFERNFQVLQKFRIREGHARVPQQHKEDGVKLGQWVSVIRLGSQSLHPDRIARLNQLNFVWNAIDDVFEQNLKLLELFVQREGHARVAQAHKEQGVRLGTWVSGLRTRKTQLTSGQVSRLDQLGFAWNALDARFEQNIALVEIFIRREGHAQITEDHVEGGQYIGRWLSYLRKKRSQLPPAQVSRFEKLGLSLAMPPDPFERNLQLLRKFVDREGDANVPKGHIEEGVRLGGWVNNLRGRRELLSKEKITQLELCGFVWNVHAKGLAQNLALLNQYFSREGHANPPNAHVEDGVRLGTWVTKLRRTRNRLSKEVVDQLNLMGFSWSGAFNDRFDRNCALLTQFVAREGHAKVPHEFVEGGVPLGTWVYNLRSNRIKLNEAQATRLKKLGVVVGPRLSR